MMDNINKFLKNFFLIDAYVHLLENSALVGKVLVLIIRFVL